MPRLSVWSVRAALLHLLVGFTLGALMLANKGQPFWPQAWGLISPHVEILLLGWIVQLALGVAFWILPRFPGGSRGNEILADVSLLLLNLGILLVAVHEYIPLLLPTGRLLEAAAGILFTLHAWGRVKPLYP